MLFMTLRLRHRSYCHQLRMLLIALTVGLVSACSSLPASRERSLATAIPVDPATPLAQVAAASIPAGGHSGTRLLPLGVFSLDARVQLAQCAQRSLIVQYYQLENDSTGRLVLQSLRDAAKRGVQVRVLVDDLYTANSQRLLLALSKIPNVEVRLYNPFCCGRDGIVSRFVASPLEIRRLNHRMHNKLFVADGALAVVGGRNIADEYFVLGEAQNFIDMDAVVAGRVVPELVAVFDTYWNSKPVWPIEEIVPAIAGRPVTGQDFDAWIGPAFRQPDLPETDFLGYGPIGHELDKGRIDLHPGEAHVIADPPTKPSFMSDDEALASSVTMKVWGLLLAANVQVELTSPYLVPGEKGMAAFEDLSNRKVKLTLLTNSLAANDEPLVHTGYARYRERLLRSGADLYELSPERTSAGKSFGAFGKSLGRLHAKTAAIDGKRIFIGSMNLDPRSATQNTEMGLVIDSGPLAQEMLRVIEVNKIRSSYRLRLTEDGKGVQWLTTEGQLETVFTEEPESTFWQRFHNSLMAPFVPEVLL